MTATVDLLRRQKLSALLLEWACTNAESIHSDRYRVITEGRRYDLCTPPSSSCADLAHWLLYRLGVRLPWINRKEHLGWRAQVNVSRLATHSGHVRLDEPLDAGDIAIVCNHPLGFDAHVICIVADHGNGWYSTAEYGQPGGELKSRQVLAGKIGSKRVTYLLRLSDMLQQAAEAGKLVEPDLPEGVR